LGILVKESFSAVQSTGKRLLFLVKDLLEILGLAVKLGEELALPSSMLSVGDWESSFRFHDSPTPRSL
jgi:hypothetical protein